MKIFWSVAWIVSCILCSMGGAYLAMHLQRNELASESLRAHKLELTDSIGTVRATFEVKKDDSVVLEMLSKQRTPVIELAVSKSQEDAIKPSASISIEDGADNLIIGLHSTKGEKGALSVHGPLGNNQVSLGYSTYGDIVDGHDRVMWGLLVRGPNHTERGTNVFDEDGALKGFTLPLEAPQLNDGRK